MRADLGDEPEHPLEVVISNLRGRTPLDAATNHNNNNNRLAGAKLRARIPVRIGSERTLRNSYVTGILTRQRPRSLTAYDP